MGRRTYTKKNRDLSFAFDSDAILTEVNQEMGNIQ